MIHPIHLALLTGDLGTVKRYTHFYLSKPGHDLEQNFWEVLMELLLWLPFIDRFLHARKIEIVLPLVSI